MKKQYFAQVCLIDKNGKTVEFFSTLQTYRNKINRIKQDRNIVSERVRFIEKRHQAEMLYGDIPRIVE